MNHKEQKAYTLGQHGLTSAGPPPPPPPPPPPNFHFPSANSLSFKAAPPTYAPQKLQTPRQQASRPPPGSSFAAQKSEFPPRKRPPSPQRLFSQHLHPSLLRSQRGGEPLAQHFSEEIKREHGNQYITFNKNIQHKIYINSPGPIAMGNMAYSPLPAPPAGVPPPPSSHYKSPQNSPIYLGSCLPSQKPSSEQTFNCKRNLKGRIRGLYRAEPAPEQTQNMRESFIHSQATFGDRPFSGEMNLVKDAIFSSREDDNGPIDHTIKIATRRITPGKRRPRKMFSDEEVNNLIRGVEHFGEGKWARILQFFDFDDRTAVDLKDKWRNLQKPSSTVKVPKDRRTRLPYSEIECNHLRLGVKVFGHNWVRILRAFPFNSERTPVDLKDKWRNLQIKSGLISPPSKKQRRFLLLDSKNLIFESVYPRDAALKAASRGYEYMKLLQIGTPRIHVFAGERKLVQRYVGREKDSVWKGRVLKLGMERATVRQLRVAKTNYAIEFGLAESHDIAPNVDVGSYITAPSDEQSMKEIFTSKADVKVKEELKMKKEFGLFKGETSTYEPSNEIIFKNDASLDLAKTEPVDDFYFQ